MRKVLVFDHNDYTQYTVHDVLRKIEEAMTADSTGNNTRMLITIEEVEVDE